MIFFFTNWNYYFQDVNLFYIVYHACPDSFEEDSFGTLKNPFGIICYWKGAQLNLRILRLILSEKLGDKCVTIPFVICNLTVGAAEERELVVVWVVIGAVMITWEWRCCLMGSTRTSSPRRRLSNSVSKRKKLRIKIKRLSAGYYTWLHRA